MKEPAATIKTLPDLQFYERGARIEVDPQKITEMIEFLREIERVCSEWNDKEENRFSDAQGFVDNVGYTTGEVAEALEELRDCYYNIDSNNFEHRQQEEAYTYFDHFSREHLENVLENDPDSDYHMYLSGYLQERYYRKP